MLAGMDRGSDLPWNDVPADSDVVPGSEEPDPAEVEGDEGEEVDVSHRPLPDPADEYRQETLDQRLSEEEPDVLSSGEQDPEAGEIQAAESDQDDLSLDVAEPDQSESDDDEAAEDAAIHIRPEGRI
jgi:hypothetical protein